jgi:hypothetical protein
VTNQLLKVFTARDVLRGSHEYKTNVVAAMVAGRELLTVDTSDLVLGGVLENREQLGICRSFSLRLRA